jgi:hypothetical protein
VGLVFSNGELVNDCLQPLGCRLWDICFHSGEQQMFLDGRWLDVLLLRNVVTGATMAFRAHFRELVLPVPSLPVTMHDGWIALAIGAVAKLHFISEPLILYRQHRNQQLGVDLSGGIAHHHLDAVIRRESYALAARYYELEIARLGGICTILSTIRKRSASCAYLEDKIELAQDLIGHYRVRGQLASQRLSRMRPVAKELRTGRYHRYSRGALSALKDLIR